MGKGINGRRRRQGRNRGKEDRKNDYEIETVFVKIQFKERRIRITPSLVVYE